MTGRQEIDGAVATHSGSPPSDRTKPVPQQINIDLGKMPIVLVGMMGAGKTTIGRRLAKRLGRRFVDADHEIEKAANMTIAEIFEVHGEADFRDGERRVIHRLLGEGPMVLATGGGAFMDDATREQLKTASVTVWLKAEFDVLMARVRRKSTRPLLRQPNPEEMMRQLIDQRYPIYAEANITVLSQDAPHSEVVDALIEKLRGYVARTDLADSGGEPSSEGKPE